MSESQNLVSHIPQDSSNKNNKNGDSSGRTNRSTSPPTQFEKFFLPIEDTNFAEAASEIATTNYNEKKQKTFASFTSESIRTDDFDSAHSNISEETDLEDISFDQNFYSNDILGLSSPIANNEELINMAKKKSNGKAKAKIETPPASEPEPKPEPAPEPTKEEGPHFDVIEHVYEGAKTAWGIGKDFVVFKPFMGLAEGVASRLVFVTTGVESLELMDKSIIPHIKGIDTDILDPAIEKLLAVLSPIIGKGEEVVKTVIGIVHKPAIKETAEDETAIPTPKVSSEVVSPETSTPAVSA